MDLSRYKDRKFFKNLGPFSLKKIAQHIDALVYCNSVLQEKTLEIEIQNIISLSDAGNKDMSFFSHKKYHKDFLKTEAIACIVEEKYIQEASKDLFLLVVKNTKVAYAKILQLFYNTVSSSNKNVSEMSFVDSSAKIGKGVEVGVGSYIGKDVVIGEGVLICPNVYIGDMVIIDDNSVIHNSASITNSIIGKNNIIHSGVRIGQDGFGYAIEDGRHIRVPQIGRVVIGDDVEIGANSTIDRGSVGDTVIGDMCKIDNLVQIGHNVKLGKGCIIVSQVGISGSTKIGNYSVLGGQVGVADNLNIGNFVQIGAQCGIMRDVEDSAIMLGSPAQPVKQFFRQLAAIKKLTKIKG